MVDEVSCLRAELSKANGDKYRLTGENNVVLGLETETTELETMIGSLVCSFEQVKTLSAGSKRNLLNARGCRSVGI